MSLHQLIIDDAPLFTSTDDFGEEIGYVVPLTVDSTSITADSTELTADSGETVDTVSEGGADSTELTADMTYEVRTINAVVFRNELSIFNEDGDTVLPVWEIHVANDSTIGIASDELNLGGDKLSFPPRDGQAAAIKSITRLLGQDHGMLILECR